MAKTITAAVLVTSASNSAGSTTRGRLDCSAADGGQIRWRITNGGTGPTVQCEARIMVARKQASMPAAAAEGTGDDAWKQVFVMGGGTTASASTRGSYTFGPEVAYVQIEFTGNTGQAVTVECTGDSYSY
ncbi:MAG: hypothetical protein KJ023_00050 [Burkholderiaceae bacterium]|nr:hypothetical protein [Burkholderiaceae bacterium]